MPVPKDKEKQYGTIVAAQTARMEKMGMSGGEANRKAKGMADRAISGKRKKIKAENVGRM